MYPMNPLNPYAQQPSFQQNPIMGQLPGYGQQQMQPLMGQMQGGQQQMQPMGGQQNPYAQRFDPRMMSYGFGMGLLGQHMSPQMRPLMSAMGHFGMQRFGQ